MQTPLVSIIIPTYNRAHLIGETLDSVLTQTYTNWECIVVDDGSTDGTDVLLEGYCKEDSRIQYHHRPKERLPGGNAVRNYGFELSKGEYINWFDDDDLMLEDFLNIKIAKFSANTMIVICSGYYVDDNLQNLKKMELNIKSDLFKNYITWKIPVLTPSVLFKKSFLNEKKLFSPNIFRGQETELFSRLFFNLPESFYKIINTPLFLYRQHPESKTNESKRYIKKHKESTAFNHIQNLKRSYLIKDSDLIKYFYKKNIKLLFSAIKYNHKNNIDFILGGFKVVKKKNMYLYIKLNFLIRLLFLFNKPAKKIENHFKNIKIKF